MGIFGTPPADEEHLICSPQGEYVTAKRVGKVADVLNPGERVHYLTVGGVVDIEGDGKSSHLASGTERKGGIAGFTRTVFTDSRIIVKAPQFTGNDEIVIPYDSIIGISVHTRGLGFANKISLRTSGPTYHIQVTWPKSSDESNAIGDYVERKISDLNERETAVQEEPDAISQIKRLKSLNDEGIISDEEFGLKKKDLLDKI